MALATAKIPTRPEKLGIVLFLGSLCWTGRIPKPTKKPVCRSLEAGLRNQKGLDWRDAPTIRRPVLSHLSPPKSDKEVGTHLCICGIKKSGR